MAFKGDETEVYLGRQRDTNISALPKPPFLLEVIVRHLSAGVTAVKDTYSQVKMMRNLLFVIDALQREQMFPIVKANLLKDSSVEWTQCSGRLLPGRHRANLLDQYVRCLSTAGALIPCLPSDMHQANNH